MTPNRQTLTYVIHIVGGPSIGGRRFYKIGRTTDRSIDSRMATLQTANPYSLEFVCILKGNQEGALHRQFHNWRVRGEWFLLDESQLLQIEGTSWEWEEQYIWESYACRDTEDCPCRVCDPDGDPSNGAAVQHLMRSSLPALVVSQ